MAITPADIEKLTFSPSKKGYEPEEVDAFLDQLSGELDAMLNKIADLKARLTNTEQQLADSQAQVASLEAQLENASAAPAIAPAPVTSTASEDQISRVLIVAQQSADKIVADAREAAESIRNEADQKAREVIRQALAEKQNELDEIDRLKQSREDFRSEYKKLLQHFMDDAAAEFPIKTLLSPNGSDAQASQPAAPAVDVNATVKAVPVAPAPAAHAFDDFSDLD